MYVYRRVRPATRANFAQCGELLWRKKTMFDIMNADQLINAVRKRSALWDPRHIGHNNRLLINKLWLEVAEEVGIDKNLAKSKWRGLRDYYRQEMKKQANFTTDDGTLEYRSSWALFDQMSFVKNTILPRRQRDTIVTITNPPEMDIDNNSEYYEEDPVNICIPKLEPQLDIPDFIPEQIPSPNDYHHDQEKLIMIRRNLKPISELKQREIMQQRHHNDIERKFAQLERTVEDSDNDDLQFFKSLLPDLINLPRAKKSYIRLKIQEIIHKEVHNNEGVVKDECC